MEVISHYLCAIVLAVAGVTFGDDIGSESQRKADEARKRMVAGVIKAQMESATNELSKLQAIQADESVTQKEKDAAKRKTRKLLYNDNPKSFYERYIENRLIQTETGLDEPKSLTGRVVQIPSSSLLIIELSRSDQWVALDGYDTSEVVDDTHITVSGVKCGGTYRYVSVLGAVKTIRRFVPARTLSYQEFELLKAEGVDVLNAVEDCIRRNNLWWL